MSRPNRFGYGVPFRYPNSDIEPGLTEDGKRLVAHCDKSGILPVIALNEAGFWVVAKQSGSGGCDPFNMKFAACAQSDGPQLAAIAESDGMVGLNFAVAFLRPDGQMNADTGIDIMLRHLDHLISHLGEDRVGLGSDFDGTTVPRTIGTAAGLGGLRAAMTAWLWPGPDA